ncbi:hypothetical protein [Thermococcus guaymasensis]|uniref:hypothetical protein n=1 Tax=Thermococcus guaymasensis TaxID=110164 RepID=UPI000782BECD|nr:hypothetical protein [Thermococcus guaymasensis]
MKKVLVKENPVGVMVIGVAFALVFIFLSMSIIGSFGSFVPTGFAAAFLLIPLLFVVILILMGSISIAGGKKASSLFNAATLSETSINFPEELEYAVGRIFLEGYWTYSSTSTGTGTGSSRTYRTRRTFRPSWRGRGLEVELPREPFRIELRADGTGIVDAPAIRVLSGPYKDAVVIFLTDEGVVEGEGNLDLSRENDMAQVTFRGQGRELRGSVWAELSKARGVRIEYGSGDLWKTVAKGKGSFEFSFSPLPEEKIVIFSHYSTVTPRSILQKLWSGPVIMGHGTFELKAVLDVPLGKDVVETAIFNVELK